ncbi:juvenile hormone epoxide hydrolase 1 [Diachasma alloeum]|uniref:juvenile hormone epoxide hydrolase 1 n=1 Tax=Diachasma alloeum TaxID=454923 RepID=UPI00073838EA|nr:juvenile hormone epoxide hydrolase 1 [Diachasma alloeum]
MIVKGILGVLLAVGASYHFVGPILLNDKPHAIPRLPEKNWGPAGVKEDTSIRPFKIDIPKNVIEDLKHRLSNTRDLTPPLEKTGWTYGISGTYLKTVLDYWRNKYDWYKRQELLNKFPQFITRIQGLDIHYIHAKPSTTVQNGKTLRILPLLLVHGWPGSIVEFQKIIPMLTTPRADADFVFEVIAPSLPGYGFSQGAVRPGLGHAQMGVIFKNLMTRLGFNKFYTQGGDWGSAITADIAILFPERVLGSHLNMCWVSGGRAMFWQLLGSYFPSLVIEPEHASKFYPMSKHWSRTIEESGYFHIQATKPDTVGVGLNDSPAGLAAYILEKFSTWTNPEYRFREDGGLSEKFTLDELLDNIMVYWATNSITTSIRLYAESFIAENRDKFDHLQSYVPTACAVSPHEILYIPKEIAKLRFKNLTQFNHLPRGGHFAAFEEPKTLSDDVWTFVKTLERA